MKKGFTIIELIAVLVIIVIIFVVAIPSIYNIVERYNKEEVAEKARELEILITNLSKEKIKNNEYFDTYINLELFDEKGYALLDEQGYVKKISLKKDNYCYKRDYDIETIDRTPKCDINYEIVKNKKVNKINLEIAVDNNTEISVTYNNINVDINESNIIDIDLKNEEEIKYNIETSFTCDQDLELSFKAKKNEEYFLGSNNYYITNANYINLNNNNIINEDNINLEFKVIKNSNYLYGVNSIINCRLNVKIY